MINNTNVSMRAVKSVLMEKCNDLWGLCHSPTINKWAKYSPQTANGNAMPFSSMPVNNPYDVEKWLYTKRTITEAKLGDFRNYKHDAQNPIAIAFPEKLYYNTTNSISMSVISSDPNTISLSDLNINDKYMGVAFRKVSNTSDKRGNWCTGHTVGDWTVPIDFTGLFSRRETVEVVVFLTDTKKESLTSPDVSGNFYSLKSDDTIIDRKTYTLTEWVPPTNYEYVFATESPMYGNWYYDELTFDNISVTVKSKVDLGYKFKVVVEFEGGDWAESRMTEIVRVAAGEEKVIFNTGAMRVNNFRRENIAWLKVVDLQSSVNNVLFITPMHNMNNNTYE